MKKLFAVFILVLALAIPVLAEPIQTIHVPWFLLRADVNDTTTKVIGTDANTNFAQKPAGAVQLKANYSGLSSINGIQLIFAGGVAADKTFTYKVYMWRAENGAGELVCYGAGTLGTTDLITWPHDGSAATLKFWADTLTCTDVWWTTVKVKDSATNRICGLSFDTCGYEWIYVEITDADGTTGTEAADVAVFYSYY